MSFSKTVDLITWMRKTDFEGHRTNEQFMEAYAERKKLFHNFHIATTDINSFINDLEKHKIIEVIHNPLYVSFRRNR